MTLLEAMGLAQELANSSGRAYVFLNQHTGEYTASVLRLDDIEASGLYEWRATQYHLAEWEVVKPRYWHAVLDEGTCAACSAKHGQRVTTYDHPPLHWGDDPRGDCRCVAREEATS